jgi:hypothetical protein
MSNGFLVLEDDHLRVGVTNLGGRVVLLARPGGANVLKVDPSLLDGKAGRRPVSVRYHFKPWNGHTVWCGPQSAFWADQDEYPRRREKHAVWPPDPYGEVGWFAATERTERRLVLTGPESPITGLQLTKVIELSDGHARFTVTARNTRSRPVRWDLWPNTRVDGRAHCYVPTGPEGVLRMQSGGRRRGEPMPHRVLDGYFTFDPQAPSPEATQRTAKAFLHPSRGEILAFCGPDLLWIRFDLPPRERVHPEHAAVELFNAISRDGDALLELETHGPYCTLEPGQTMSLEQRWQVLRYDGPDGERERIGFLESLEG